MSLRRLQVSNFTAFEDVALDLVEGINVLIGENGTGKTHLLKLMLAAHRFLERGFRESTARSRSAGFMSERLTFLFRVDDDLSQLCRHKKANTSINVLSSDRSLKIEISPHNNLSVHTGRGSAARQRAIFVPARECVTLANDGFAGLFKRFPLLDETVADICNDLQVPQTRGALTNPLGSAAAAAEKASGGRVVFRGGRFYWREGDRHLRIHLAAEGHRRLGEVARLVKNESIAPKGILLWDEPEANLNPVLLRAAIELIRDLAREDVQVVVATHSYLLTQQISLFAEFPEKQDPKVRFFGLTRSSEKSGVKCDAADSIGDLRDNPLLKEHARQYDFDVAAAERFTKAMRRRKSKTS